MSDKRSDEGAYTFYGAYGRVRCAWCHKRHRAGTLCRVRDREEKPKAKKTVHVWKR